MVQCRLTQGKCRKSSVIKRLLKCSHLDNWVENHRDIELPRGQRTHVLRHTFASHFVINGGNLLTLQKIMGHQSIQMTMRYAHLAPDHLKEAITYGPRIFG
ncbi:MULTISPECIES: tyrosine-type recombinase/integrase [Halomonas]|uniref:tyrosine-type recombinase/integrase n=2 Tax=Halomonadaceae TaxID=28256 RepID=UPI003CE7FFB7